MLPTLLLLSILWVVLNMKPCKVVTMYTKLIHDVGALVDENACLGMLLKRHMEALIVTLPAVGAPLICMLRCFTFSIFCIYGKCKMISRMTRKFRRILQTTPSTGHPMNLKAKADPKILYYLELLWRIVNVRVRKVSYLERVHSLKKYLYQFIRF